MSGEQGQRSEVRGQRSERKLSALRYHLAEYHAACAAHGNQSSAAWYFIECVERTLGQNPKTYETLPVLKANEAAARELHEARGGQWSATPQERRARP